VPSNGPHAWTGRNGFLVEEIRRDELLVVGAVGLARVWRIRRPRVELVFVVVRGRTWLAAIVWLASSIVGIFILGNVAVIILISLRMLALIVVVRVPKIWAATSLHDAQGFSGRL